MSNSDVKLAIMPRNRKNICLPNRLRHEFSQNRIIKRAQEFIASQEQDPLNVQELAIAANTSTRTLERVFKREFGITPKKYLLGHRLSGAYRQLWHSSPGDTRIADVANAWGFWHMGQFAKDYLGFFGELPSETLNKSHKNRVI